MITYRAATDSDAGQLLCLLEEIMRDHGVASPPRERLCATIATILESTSHMFLVADEQGRLVGMCALIFSQSTWSASLVCELQDVIVTRGRRLAQVGRGLLESAEEVARSRGCSRLFLSAESWNLDAHTFYRRHGLAEKTYLYFERDLGENRRDPRQAAE
jgi:GNAT superfamily N-acetyltransferase